MTWLTPAFCLTALLYASVGFAGGSTYTALLALGGVSAAALPVISLCCNILVSAGGTWRFAQAGQIDWRRSGLLAGVAAPLSYWGGRTQISEQNFLTLLAACLIVAGLLLLVQKSPEEGDAAPKRVTLPILGGAVGLGYLAGLVGIGGGVFLAPLLHFTRWASARQIAATASLFILINSVAGLAGQSQKLDAAGGLMSVLMGYWPLFLAVVIGGQMGSLIGIRILPPPLIRRGTAILILYVAGQLIWKLMK